MRSFLFSQLALLGGICLSVLSQAQSTNGTNSAAASVFVSPAVDIAFALNVPADSITDLYFSLMIPIRITWGAIGLGSKNMAGSLILMAYSSASGKNVTLSPRLAYGHSEPVYTSGINVEALPGTGLINETTYVFNGKCTNCRSWNGGSVDVSSKEQNCLYATGPDGNIDSDDLDAPLQMHWNYGTFTMDMVHATGPGGLPVINTEEDSESIAATQGLSVFKKKDVAATVHAIMMIFCFFGLMPFGILILRVGGFVRWHAINQGLALIGVTVGVALGIHISFFYNRSKNFNDPHQIIGLVVFILIFGQLVLGFLHHRFYKKTQQPTKLAPVHVWLGRLLIVLGVTNAFLGFPFAQNSKRNYILAGLVIFIFPVVAILILTKSFIRKRWARTKEETTGGQGGGYNMEPWRQTEEQTGMGHRAAVTAQHQNEPPPSNIGLSDMRSYSNYQSSQGRRVDLGPPQSAREYV
ncbi:uncharacterized protein BCR38DRAFT_368758 [Pseudomassariella vexata]|uniref:Cytochrome b561 domain-containing protein n=1 Tax=Pseudomassariella vexata TaxID=1141098 RepID=A0A1Y2E1X6_9PEZI|nr:uncharacterized protein BCR38DRAFT_368758 [Pseudomassariella vexata]ORY65457.1 hypothetical protein BCR38DRAFT_368758 [Pseudomassariella vexata]